jgi:hypothetical protein
MRTRYAGLILLIVLLTCAWVVNAQGDDPLTFAPLDSADVFTEAVTIEHTYPQIRWTPARLVLYDGAALEEIPYPEDFAYGEQGLGSTILRRVGELYQIRHVPFRGTHGSYPAPVEIAEVRQFDPVTRTFEALTGVCEHEEPDLYSDAVETVAYLPAAVDSRVDDFWTEVADADGIRRLCNVADGAVTALLPDALVFDAYFPNPVSPYRRWVLGLAEHENENLRTLLAHDQFSGAIVPLGVVEDLSGYKPYTTTYCPMELLTLYWDDHRVVVQTSNTRFGCSSSVVYEADLTTPDSLQHIFNAGRAVRTGTTLRVVRQQPLLEGDCQLHMIRQDGNQAAIDMPCAEAYEYVSNQPSYDEVLASGGAYAFYMQHPDAPPVERECVLDSYAMSTGVTTSEPVACALWDSLTATDPADRFLTPTCEAGHTGLRWYTDDQPGELRQLVAPFVEYVVSISPDETYAVIITSDGPTEDFDHSYFCGPNQQGAVLDLTSGEIVATMPIDETLQNSRQYHVEWYGDQVAITYEINAYADALSQVWVWRPGAGNPQPVTQVVPRALRAKWLVDNRLSVYAVQGFYAEWAVSIVDW